MASMAADAEEHGGRVDVGERGELREDGKGEAFEEAEGGVQQPPVLEQQYDDGKSDGGDVAAMKVSEHEGSGGLHGVGGYGDGEVAGAVEVSKMEGNFARSQEGSERVVDGETMVEANGRGKADVGNVGVGVHTTEEVETSGRKNVEDANVKRGMSAPVETVELEEDYGGSSSDFANLENLVNGHPNHGISHDCDNFISIGSANYVDPAPELQDGIVERERDENLRSGSDGGINAQPGVVLSELSCGSGADDNEDTESLERNADSLIGMNAAPLDGRTEMDRDIGLDLCQNTSNHLVLPEQPEERQNTDDEIPDLSELPEVNNGSQESVIVEDAYDSTSGNDFVEMEAPSMAAGGTQENISLAQSLPSRPAGLGNSEPLLEPSSRASRQPRLNGSTTQRQAPLSENTVNASVEEYDETREMLQVIRVNFLRLAHRLGQTPHNVVVAQVLYRLGLAEQLQGSATRAGAFSFDRASALAEQLEASGQEPLDFSCTIMVIGKTGVGKSATINSILGESKFRTDAFGLGTREVQDVVGLVQGIKVRLIDTPGLLPSFSDQGKNEKILKSIKSFIKKTPPDVIIYLDRLDIQNRDVGDIPLLQTITNVFGPSIWLNAIVVLTHAASAPPEGANGNPLSYEMYVSQRTHVIQSAIRHAVGDPRLMNPVSLVENHSACRMNRAGQRVLPNGQVWKPHLLLLSFASKILAEANALLRLQDTPLGRPFSARSRAPPLPFFLSSLLQLKPQLKLPDEMYGNDDGMGIDMDEETDSDDELDYDKLPPFRNLTKEELSMLSKTQKRDYYEELDYRERLFYRKKIKAEKKQRKLLKKRAVEADKEQPYDSSNEKVEEERAGPASVPVPMPDMALPASFDSDHPTYRYCSLDANQWLVRPVLETQGWDHDVGYDGVNIEKMFVVKDNIPVSISGQLVKDKKECTLQMDLATAMKPREGVVTSYCMDLQTVGKDVAYTVCGETKLNNRKCHSTVAGVSASFLGGTSSVGLKMEHRLVVNKMLSMLVNGGMMTGRGDIAYGGRFEAIYRDKDYPIGRMLSTLALSVMDWHGDLALSGNVQSQVPIGRCSNLVGHASLNSKGTGQVGIRLNSSEQLQIALLAAIPLLRSVKRFLLGSPESM